MASVFCRAGGILQSDAKLMMQRGGFRGKMARKKPKLAVMKRRKWGLYGGKHVLFGNNVSHSVRRTRRKWKPNVQRKKLWSDALDKWVRVKVTTYTLRSIDKMGGLDNYLLHPKRNDLDSVVGQRLTQLVVARLAELDKLESQAEAQEYINIDAEDNDIEKAEV